MKGKEGEENTPKKRETNTNRRGGKKKGQPSYIPHFISSDVLSKLFNK